jgi:hypothetical protein
MSDEAAIDELDRFLADSNAFDEDDLERIVEKPSEAKVNDCRTLLCLDYAMLRDIGLE